MSLENQLLKWYLINKRDLPWRKNKDPYSVWISEIILQQTRVSKGIQYYKNFMERFPNIEKLSTSKESHVLKAWQGLSSNKEAAQQAFSHRAKMNKLAALGQWNKELETK